MTYNEHGKRIRSENLAGRIATKVAQGEGGLGLKTDMAYTVKHIQKGQALWAKREGNVCYVELKCVEWEIVYGVRLDAKGKKEEYFEAH